MGKAKRKGRPEDGKRYFEEIQQLLEKHGGYMEWRPQPPGGWWDMYLEGRIASVRFTGQEPSGFDGLYVGEEVKGGRATYPYELVDGAFWRLMDMFHDQA